MIQLGSTNEKPDGAMNTSGATWKVEAPMPHYPTILVCSIPGCGKPVSSRGWCESHYYRWRRHGSPYTTMLRPFAERFWEKVDKSSKCWIWTASTVGRGYGRVGDNGRLYLAHRVSFEMKYGPIPEGMCVLHKCDVPSCVNPEHLFLGTNDDNVADKVRKGRSRSGRGERHGSAKLTERDVRMIREIYRQGNASQRQLARQYGVNRSSIRRIVNGTTWKHVSDELEFAS